MVIAWLLRFDLEADDDQIADCIGRPASDVAELRASFERHREDPVIDRYLWSLRP